MTTQHQSMTTAELRPPTTGQHGWLSSRWGRIVAVAFGLAFLAAAIHLPWVAGTVLIIRSNRNSTIPTHEATAHTTALEIRPWGPIFLACTAVLLVATAVAIVMPRSRAASWLAGGATLVGAAALGAASSAVSEASTAYQKASESLFELLRTYGAADIERDARLGITMQTEGILWAIWAAVVLALAAAVTIRPSSGPIVVAGTGTILVAASVSLPWLLVSRIYEDSATLEPAWWPALGAPAVTAIAAAALVVAATWFAVLTRARLGAIALTLIIVGTTVAVVLGQAFSIDPHEWMAASARGEALSVGVGLRMWTIDTLMVAEVILAVAAAMAWRRNRARRASTVR